MFRVMALHLQVASKIGKKMNVIGVNTAFSCFLNPNKNPCRSETGKGDGQTLFFGGPAKALFFPGKTFSADCLFIALLYCCIPLLRPKDFFCCTINRPAV